MKGRPGLRQVASTLLKVFVQRFMKVDVMDPQARDFDPIYAEATFLDPRHKILRPAAQLQAAMCGLLREVCPV